MPKYAKRLDANHTEIVNDLKKMGVHVYDLNASGSGLTDIMIHRGIRTSFVELKHGKDAVVKKTQVKFLSEWAGFCGIARSLEDVLAIINAPHRGCLTQTQKDRLAAYYRTMTAKHVSLNVLEKVINGTTTS